MAYADINTFDDRNVEAGAAGAEEPAAGSASMSSSARQAIRRKRGNLLLVGLFAAGIGCVYLLSLRQGPAEASAQQQAAEAQVESALAKITASGTMTSSAKAKTLVDAFYYQASQRQIPLRDLWGNPFVFQAPQVKEAPKPVETQPRSPQPGERSKDVDPLAEVSRLSLQSVLTGAKGRTAIISNNLLTEGQMICGWMVQSIQPQEVVLVREDRTYVLKMR